MTYLTLRWLFLALALAGAGASFLFGLTLERAALTAACALAWVVLSRRKARSLDREVLGVPPRA